MLSVRLSSLASVWLTDSRVTKPTEAWWLKNNNPFVTRDSVGQRSGWVGLSGHGLSYM